MLSLGNGKICFKFWRSYNLIKMAIKSETKEKIILLLASGVVLGLSRSPRNYFKVLKGAAKEWKEINRNKLVRIVREFYNDRLIDYKEDKDGSVKIILTKEGQKKALKFKLDEMEIKKPAKWDGEWRIVIFDIPERFKKAREALRMKLKDLGFLELQKSVLVLPYECEDEIDFIVEVFLIRPFVRFVRVKSFTNEEQLKIKFGLY
ncbi:MAG: Transcriptional regulator, PaaX family [Parcubacteria group bacterium GW2011_GWB1_43_8]|nr:MAG: Transcriptional regulator, PaaX family [Parcubacteria group bacterium GW2011_GWB1_43_8]